MWKRNELCSKGVPCRSRIRNRISPSSDSSISSLRRAKLTRAPFTTERSSAIASSSRTKPWSRTGTVLSGITSGVTATAASVPGLYVGTSGWSYPSWRPDFYPAGTKPEDFLRYSAARDDGLLTLALGSFDASVSLAFDFRHESWDGIEADLPPNAARVGSFEADAPFRYLRLREPPYDEEQLRDWAERLRPLLDDDLRVYVYFKHEDEPTGPRYAQRLIESLAG